MKLLEFLPGIAQNTQARFKEAIYALEHGVDEANNLNDEDRAQIKEFTEKNFPHGYTFSVRWDERNEFDVSPAFGLPCATYTVDFVRL